MEQQFRTALAWITAKASEAYKYSLLIVAFGSTLVIYQWILAKGQELNVHWAICGLAALLAANTWYRSIEHTLKVFMPFGALYILTDKAEAQLLGKRFRQTGRTTLGAVVILSAATVSLSLIINPDIAESFTVEADSSNELASADQATTSYNSDVERLQQQYEEAKQYDTDALAQAKAQAAALLRDAELSQGQTMYKLYKEGNGWAAGKLKSAIARAKAKGSKVIDNVTPTSPTAKDALTNYISVRSASRDTINQATALLVANRHQDYRSKLSRRNYMLFGVVIIAFLVAVVSCFLMVLGRMERNEEIIDDESPGIIKTAKAAAQAIDKKIAARMADKWKVQFVGAAPAGVALSAHEPIRKRQATTPKTMLPETVLAAVSLPSQSIAPVSDNLATLKSEKTDIELTVNCLKTDRSVSVVIDGKTYNAIQAQDKVRKFYARSKTAKTERGRKDNAGKYFTCKTVMEPHFTFDEQDNWVSIKLK